MVELMAVIIVLGVLAAVAAPKFFDYGDEAKESAVKGTLGAVRSAIASFRADAAMKEGEARFPTGKEIKAIGTVMEEPIPENPYADVKNPERIKVVRNEWKSSNPPTYKGNYGWVYDEKQGKFWTNTRTKKIKENEW